MRNLPLPLLLLGTLCAVSGLRAGAGECPPGNINVKDRPPIEGAFIESETIEKVVYYLGNPKDSHSAKSELTHDKYLNVTWNGAEDGNFLAGQVNYEKGEWEKAEGFFKKALGTAKWFWEIEDCYMRSAECAGKAVPPRNDDALAMLKELSEKFPQTVHLPDLVGHRAALELAKGDFNAALEDYRKMVQNGVQWGGFAIRDGMLGQRNVLRGQKKFDAAIALLAPEFAKLAPEAAAEEFAPYGLDLAEDLDASGKSAEAMAACKRIYLAPIGPEGQSKAHLKAARLLAAGNTTAGNIAAFDQAALAATMSADDETEVAAKKMMRELVARIDKDKAVSDNDRKEYRKYASMF
jgi:tetratricopeptide (TPR) repeat protein